MKKILSILFVFISTISFAQNTHLNPVNQGGATSQGATYYVSPTGLSTGSGSTPATAITFARLITFSSSFVGDEKIYLQAGGNYYGDLIVQSGTSIDMYGTGTRPIIRGTILSTAIAWTQAGNIWYATVTSRINRLFRNGVPERNAQSAYYTITTHTSSTNITASSAAGLGSWAGTCEMVSKFYDFAWAYDTATAYNSGTGQFTLAYGRGGNVGFGLKLLNDTNLIAADGDWAYKAGKIYYRSPGNVNPNTLNVELSIYNEGIKIEKNRSNITINNIKFFGQLDGLYGDSVNIISIKNCEFKNQLNSGMAFSTSAYGINITNTVIDSVSNAGLFFPSTHNSSITRTRVSNIGVGTEPPLIRDTTRYYLSNPGYVRTNQSFGNTGYGILLAPNSNNNIIEEDTLYNISFSGIIVDGSNAKINRNIVHDYCMRQTDGGGIYLYSNYFTYKTVYGYDTIKNAQIANNIIYNGVGNDEAGPGGSSGVGVYLDIGVWNSIVQGNTINNCGYGVIRNWQGKNVKIIGNAIRNCPQLIREVNNTANSGDTTAGDIIEQNMLASLSGTQQGIQIFDYGNISFNPFLSGGSCKDNIFVSPYGNNIIQKSINAGTATNYTLATARTNYGVLFGQQDLFTEGFVNSDSANAHIPLNINSLPHTRSTVTPVGFRNPLDRNGDVTLGPYMSAVYIKEVPFLKHDSGTVQINGAYSFRTVNIGGAGANLGIQNSGTEDVVMGVSNGANVGITGSLLNDFYLKSTANTKRLLFSGNNGTSIGAYVDSIGIRSVLTLPNSPVGSLSAIGMYIGITSPTTTTIQPTAFRADLLSGYTGALSTIAQYGGNVTAGTGTSLDSANVGFKPIGNYGGLGFTKVTTTGNNMGYVGTAGGGNRNFGVWGSAVDLKNSALNGGVTGFGLNNGTSPIFYGGAFFLGANSTATYPTFKTAALQCDNWLQARPIFLASDNGSTVFTIDDGGFVGVGTAAITTAQMKIAAGTATVAPLILTSGTNNTSPQAGAVEFDGTNYFGTASTTRYTLAKTLTNTATLDFGSTAAGTASDLTITVTGAADGDAVSVGVPNGSTVANGSFTAWVSGTNTVTVRFTNNNLVTALDPASGTFRVSVIKY